MKRDLGIIHQNAPDYPGSPFARNGKRITETSKITRDDATEIKILHHINLYIIII